MCGISWIDITSRNHCPSRKSNTSPAKFFLKLLLACVRVCFVIFVSLPLTVMKLLVSFSCWIYLWSKISIIPDEKDLTNSHLCKFIFDAACLFRKPNRKNKFEERKFYRLLNFAKEQKTWGFFVFKHHQSLLFNCQSLVCIKLKVGFSGRKIDI